MNQEPYPNTTIIGMLEETLNDGLFRYDIKGVWLYTNPAMNQLFGIDRFQGVLLQHLFAEDSMCQDLLTNLKSHGQVVQQRILFKRRDNRNFWGALTCKINSSGNQKYIHGLITNINDFVQNEVQLREKANALEKSTLELDRFIYSASHDMRAPISSMLGIINVMKLDIPGEKAAEYAAMLETSAKKLDDFVRELTGYARNARQLKEDIKIDFQQLVQDLQRDFAKDLNQIELEIEIHDTFQFFSDPFRVRLILYNVFKNALDYVDRTKARSLISLQVVTSPGYMRMEITDTGIGIAPLHIDKVFDMFYRATTSSKGSGLGLYIAREAVIKLAGNITLHSEYGVGTSVHIEIPNSKKGILINKKKYLRQQSASPLHQIDPPSCFP